MGGFSHFRGDRPGEQAQLLPQLHGSCSRPQLTMRGRLEMWAML
jgi:hypothetical protein